MKNHSKSKSLLALVLAISIVATGCSAQWINIALQDLPVLTQMALNIATLVSALSTTNQANEADQAVIQNIPAQASGNLNLLQTLYIQSAKPIPTTTPGRIQSVIADLNQNLPALLESADISNATITARVICGGEPNSDDVAITSPASLPTTRYLKKSWNQKIWVATGSPEFDRALADCSIR